MSDEIVEIYGTIIHETDVSILLTDGDIEVWLLLSLIKYDPRCGVGDEVVVEVPIWLARDKGLI